MALSSQPAGHPNWGRWSQPVGHEYAMIPDNQSMMVYSSRQPSPEYVNRQVMVQQYMAPYTSAHVPAMTAAHYSPSTTSYAPYTSPLQIGTAPVSYSQRYDSHQETRSIMSDDSNSRLYHREDVKPAFDSTAMSPSPSQCSNYSVKREPTIPEQTINAKVITANETINPNNKVDFHTEIDQLMKTLQHDEPENEAQSPAQVPTPAPSPKYEECDKQGTPPCSSPAKVHNARPKKYTCNGPNCNKSFSQKTHLEIHRRTHSGLRPYVCDYAGCGLTFSQLGNLKTHKRRHTGDKPFKCSKCDKTFAQRGNVKSHEETHEGLKPFVCILDNCDKKFSQLGNMKTHQNNFHKDALQDLTQKFVKFNLENHIPEEYRTLYSYFKAHYKNSNKGIKGRGKARRIAGGRDSKPRSTTRGGRKTQAPAYKPTSPASQPQSPAAGPLYPTTSGPMPMSDTVTRHRLPTGFTPHVFPMENHHAPHMMYDDAQSRQVHGLY
ncbi:hypothetical protein V2G26_008409 [Clonostachys chloroleuca]